MTIDPTEILHRPLKYRDTELRVGVVLCDPHQNSDLSFVGLLGERGERPIDHCAPEKGDEIPPPHDKARLPGH
jgi:hypothetical protein